MTIYDTRNVSAANVCAWVAADQVVEYIYIYIGLRGYISLNQIWLLTPLSRIYFSEHNYFFVNIEQFRSTKNNQHIFSFKKLIWISAKLTKVFYNFQKITYILGLVQPFQLLIDSSFYFTMKPAPLSLFFSNMCGIHPHLSKGQIKFFWWGWFTLRQPSPLIRHYLGVAGKSYFLAFTESFTGYEALSILVYYLYI